MRIRTIGALLVLAYGLAGRGAAADPIPIDSLFSGIRVFDASISPDARYLALVLRSAGRSFVAVRDRTSSERARPLLAADGATDVGPQWCRWANARRLICGFASAAALSDYAVFRQRLVAIDADGRNRVPLLAADPANVTNYYRPEIVAWTGDDAQHVLASALTYPGGNMLAFWRPAEPLLVPIDIESGRMGKAITTPESLEHFRADASGTTLLGTGFRVGVKDGAFVAYSMAGAAEPWKRLSRLESHARDARFLPVSVDSRSGNGFMLMDHDGRVALWKVDLSDQRDPEVVFWHTEFNVADVLTGEDQRVLGVRLDTSAIGPWYVDTEAIRLDESLRRKWPDRWNDIVSTTADMKTAVVRSWGGSITPTYSVVASRDRELQIEPIGSAAPGLDTTVLPTTEAVAIPLSPARRIYGELTLPIAGTVEKAPLIVLVSDWDSRALEFDALAKLLASHGFAVLRPQTAQSNRDHRWDLAPFADWAGHIYDEVIGATHWAAAQPGIDGANSCIVGLGYGGYVALLAATQTGNDFKCAASINGYSDLAEPRAHVQRAYNRETAGSGPLAADEPPSAREQATAAHARVLLIHFADKIAHAGGAEPGQSKAMASALKKAGKPHRLVIVDALDEAFERRIDEELLGFLPRPAPDR